MEELQDAIEDAQYVSAISSVEDGPRPVLPWEIPEVEELATWKESVMKKYEEKKKDDKDPIPPPTPFGFEWTLAQALGFFLFSAYLKESVGDHVKINFMEEVIRWKGTSGRFRAEKTSFIVDNYLAALPEGAIPPPTCEPILENEEQPPPDENGESEHKAEGAAAPAAPEKVTAPIVGPPKTEINEYDFSREPTSFEEDEIKEIIAHSADPTKTCIGVGGQVLKSILDKVDKLKKAPGYSTLSQGSLHDEMLEDEKDKGGEYIDIFETKKKKKKDKNGSSNEHKDDDKDKEERRSEKIIAKRSLRNMSLVSNSLPESLFDQAEVIVAETIREKHWAGFQASEHHAKLLNFLWFQDRTVVEEDFFVMRVLGRGGFGLVTGECPHSSLSVLQRNHFNHFFSQ